MPSIASKNNVPRTRLRGLPAVKKLPKPYEVTEKILERVYEKAVVASDCIKKYGAHRYGDAIRRADLVHPQVVYIEHRCKRCRTAIRYPVITTCSCGKPVRQTGERTLLADRERHDPFSVPSVLSYRCVDLECGSAYYVVPAMYEPTSEEEDEYDCD